MACTPARGLPPLRNQSGMVTVSEPMKTLAFVVFTTPTREQGSADVVTNPLGAYTGVNPKQGP